MLKELVTQILRLVIANTLLRVRGWLWRWYKSDRFSGSRPPRVVSKNSRRSHKGAP